MYQKDIKITVELDNDHIPTNIRWQADDMTQKHVADCRAMLLSLWDSKNKDTLKLDLWTKNMTVDEMKIFFSASINSLTEGESHSAASVRESLKKLISCEPMNNPLSDEALVSKLQHEGINLARRTVAKYRELLNIPSSSIRRRMMKIQNLNI